MAVIDIDANGDLTVEVKESTVDFNGQRTAQTAQFKVNRKTLTQVSQPLLQMLVGSHWAESAQDVVSLGEGKIIVAETWLRVVHKSRPSYVIALSELWHLVEAIDYYELDLTMFCNWFDTWYEKKNALMLRPKELLFPTWRFDHARGFAKWTEQLAYACVGHITEKNPSKLKQYHLPSRLIQQLNAAKGRLRTVLHRGLFGPCEHLFAAGCSCKEKIFFGYQKHLHALGVWPLEKVFMKSSINEILDNLLKFSYEAPASACGQCRQDSKGMVAEITISVGDYFDGLCLDCLDRSKPKTRDVNMDYWRHHTLKEHEFVRGCRFKHKQPTWYFSFNGRKDERDRLVKEKQFDNRKWNRPRSHHDPDNSENENQDDEDGWGIGGGHP